MKEPMVFSHICREGDRGKALSEEDFSSFVASVAISIIGEGKANDLSAFRLLCSNTVCVIDTNRLILVPFCMYPNSAEVKREDIEEGERLSRSLKLSLYDMPLSFASLGKEPDKRASGGDYVVKIGDIKAIK